MEITDVRVKLIQEPNDRLKAVCSLTMDGVFVVRDLKVVEGTQGLFVAMPSRKLTAHCTRCGSKNHLRARFCNECGSKLPPPRVPAEGNGRTKLHRDIAHPITTEFRELIQGRVIEAYDQELELSRQPGYMPRDIEETEEVVEPVEPPMIEPAEEPEDEPSEYDALIAGLRGRPAPGAAPRGPVRREGVRPSDGGRSDGGRTEGGRSDGGRFRDSGGRGAAGGRPYSDSGRSQGGRPHSDSGRYEGVRPEGRAETGRSESDSGRSENRGEGGRSENRGQGRRPESRPEGGRADTGRPPYGGSGESRPRPRTDRGGPPRSDAPYAARDSERREPPARPAPPPARPAPPPPPPVEEAVEDNDEPFGAGLL